MEEKKYDYFKNEDFVLHGRYAKYVDAMWVQGKIEDHSRFKRLVDLYAVGAIIGLRIGNKRADDFETDDKRTVQLKQIAGEYDRFKTIMQVILLIDDSRNMTPEEKARIAFDTNDKSEYRYKEDMELFNSYARGGIEYLYNKLVLRSTKEDDEFVDARVANIMALFNDDMQGEAM